MITKVLASTIPALALHTAREMENEDDVVYTRDDALYSIVTVRSFDRFELQCLSPRR